MPGRKLQGPRRSWNSHSVFWHWSRLWQGSWVLASGRSIQSHHGYFSVPELAGSVGHAGCASKTHEHGNCTGLGCWIWQHVFVWAWRRHDQNVLGLDWRRRRAEWLELRRLWHTLHSEPLYSNSQQRWHPQVLFVGAVPQTAYVWALWCWTRDLWSCGSCAHGLYATISQIHIRRAAQLQPGCYCWTWTRRAQNTVWRHLGSVVQPALS